MQISFKKAKIVKSFDERKDFVTLEFEGLEPEILVGLEEIGLVDSAGNKRPLSEFEIREFEEAIADFSNNLTARALARFIE